VTPKNILKILFPIVMTTLMIIVIKVMITDEEAKEEAIDMVSDPIAFFASFAYDVISVQAPEYGSKERQHKVIDKYQANEIKKIVQPLQTLKENNNTKAYNKLRESYIKELFKIVQSPNARILQVKAYLNSDININIQDEKKRTLLYYATAMKNDYLVRYLLKEGADPEIRDYVNLRPVDLLDKDQDTKLYLAFYHGDVIADAQHKGLSNVSATYRYDANGKIISTQVYGERQSSWTPLMMAINNGQTDEAEKYISSDQDIHAETNNGSTALFFAIKFKNDAIVDLLLNHGANIEHRNKFNMNPLALAIKTDNLYAVKTLVEHGANTHAVCASSRTPIKYAEVNRRDNIMEYLKSVGAS